MQRFILLLLAALMLGACAMRDRELSVEERWAFTSMATEADGVVTSLAQMENLRPRTPESLMLRLEWRRKLLDAKMDLAAGDDERKSLLAEYAADCAEIDKAVEARISIDATTAGVGEARYAVAQAAYLQALVAGDEKGSLAALTRMETEAKAAYQGIVDIENIRQHTPEFFAMKVQWSRRLLDARVTLATSGGQRKKLIVEGLAEVHAASGNQPVSDLDGGPRPPFWDHAAASLELLQADEAGSKQDAQAAAEKMLAAAKAVNASLNEMAKRRQPTPEFLGVRLSWLKRELDARVMVAANAGERRKAAADYWGECQTIDADVEARKLTGATAAELHMAGYAVAEAGFLKGAAR